MAEVRLEARSAFEGLLTPIGASHGVLVEERHPQIATVIARSPLGNLGARVRQALGFELVPGTRRSGSGDLAFLGVGPRTWLAVSQARAPLTERLQQELGALAAVTDQSDGYSVLRLGGQKARTLFEKGLGVDLHPRAFEPDDVASTLCGHIGVIIWQVDEAPTYDVAMFRSYAADFCHWLSASAAELGLGIRGSPGWRTD